MLNKVTLTNFQRHRNLEVVLPGGLTALRGSNEAGKSTLLRAICYALFGVGALNSSLEEAVTWGEPVNTLKVVVQFTADGVTYEVRRGKSGAEVNYDGGIVTGQKEVTAFICRTLKVDAAAAGRLMLSNQNEIRGALESGTKATTELIERLAEFDQIDNLIELMQAKLTLGSPAVAEAALARAQETLVSAQELAKAPDLSGLEQAVDASSMEVGRTEGNLRAAQAAEAAAQEAHASAREKAVKHAETMRALGKAQGQVTDLTQQLNELDEVKAPSGSEEALRSRIDDAEDHEHLRLVYLQAEPYLGVPEGPRIVGGVAGVEAALEEAAQNVQRASNDITRLEGELRLQQSALTHGTCSFCGKDFSGVPEVEARNAATRGRIDDLAADLDTAKACAVMWEQNRSEAAAVHSASKPRLRLLSAHPDLVEALDDQMPPRLVWLKEVPAQDSADVGALKAELKALQTAQRQYETAQTRIGTLRPLLEAAAAEVKALEEKVAGSQQVYIPQDELDAARADVKRAADAVKAAVEHHHQAKQALKDAKDGHSRALKSLEDAQEVVRQRSAEIDALVFNNKLLKRVREARPIIADRLWNLVLRAVSNYFSEIRGTKSRVTKDSDGFKVDDHPVATLSGSTLDALGLAIRVALVRTFLPSAPFLILDEPAAAMDEDRTHNMLGFLASVGFQQILLVTHEDVSESVADNMIQL